MNNTKPSGLSTWRSKYCGLKS